MTTASWKSNRAELQLLAEFLRKELAPLALDAYPEAYEELKHCLLTLVFSQENADNPVSPQWDLNTRHTLAAQLGRAARQAKGLYPVS